MYLETGRNLPVLKDPFEIDLFNILRLKKIKKKVGQKWLTQSLS